MSYAQLVDQVKADFNTGRIAGCEEAEVPLFRVVS
jgi:hypothetical protein